MFLYLVVLAIGSTVGLQAWTTLFNNVTVVFLPAIGGYLWIIDYRIPIFVGVVIALISLQSVRSCWHQNRDPCIGRRLRRSSIESEIKACQASQDSV
ncbi:hypothetical protein [Desulfosarcina ovata]|uniref:Uncharacterized protein n=1 Tax=Desulfosarcina ovata subsp. ovata TaxID=2752305 RepID=A0A5K8AED5_9BACT|nr:hypothetical protein [Desulfosarcina ovata]BBO90320.1 hypothetical protein DSCOOX_35000 [Desulfosarcina ovata subsp. ovata]